MTDHPDHVGTLAAPAAADVPAVLASCHARLLEREGIAMFVALDDARPGRDLRVGDPGALRDGGRAETNGARGGEPKEPESAAHAVLHLMGFCNSCDLSPVDK